MYSGRIGRRGFFTGSAFLLVPLLLPLTLYFIVLAPLSATSAADTGVFDRVTYAVLFFVWAVWLLLLPIYFGLMVRRLHDMELSGWLSLLHLLPFINVVVYLVLLVFPGTRGPNRYGDPNDQKDPQRILFGNADHDHERKVRYGKL